MPATQSGNAIVVYEPDETTRLDVRLENETVWLTQEQMCQLFGRTQSVIARHIGNIFKEGELDRKVVYAKFAYTTRHGAIEGKTQTKEVGLYNLDVVISVGYRVRHKHHKVHGKGAERVHFFAVSEIDTVCHKNSPAHYFLEDGRIQG